MPYLSIYIAMLIVITSQINCRYKCLHHLPASTPTNTTLNTKEKCNEQNLYQVQWRTATANKVSSLKSSDKKYNATRMNKASVTSQNSRQCNSWCNYTQQSWQLHRWNATNLNVRILHCCFCSKQWTDVNRNQLTEMVCQLADNTQLINESLHKRYNVHITQLKVILLESRIPWPAFPTQPTNVP